MTPTDNAFEDRLLDAILDRFDTLTDRPTPLPLPHRTKTRRYAVPVGCLAAAATAVAVIAGLSGPAPAKPVEATIPTHALAAWTSHPTSAPPAQITVAENLCSGSFDQAGAAPPSSSQKQAPPLVGGPWSALLFDTRGDLTLALYSDGSHMMACLADPSFVWLSSIDPTGDSPVADNTAILDEVSTRGAAGDPLTLAVGRIGPGVTAVGLQLVDGSMVTATVGNGRLLAWWPRDEGVQALSVTTSTGTRNYPVDAGFARSGPQPSNRTVHSLTEQPNKSS